jgi:hypothetical protein
VYLVVQEKLRVLDVVATVVSTPLSNPSAPLDPATATFNVTVTTRVNLTVAGAVAINVTGNWSEGVQESITPHAARTLQLPAGVSTVTNTLSVYGVELWWPAGYEGPSLF